MNGGAASPAIRGIEPVIRQAHTRTDKLIQEASSYK